ncbi:MAG: threonylcarbamoyl-AMP synthase [Bacteroidia bacterium]|nr:threonylcarbamoyl-AMP synthase [Bacteroidia bacterium]
MLISIRNKNPDQRQIIEIANLFKSGALVIVPTDTVYAASCILSNPKSVENLASLLNKKIKKVNFSIICKDLSSLSKYSLQVSNQVFKLMKQVLPGPFTFILKANSNVPKIFRESKKTIGIRVPDCEILQKIVEELGEPIVVTSINSEDEITEYYTDPFEIEDIFHNKVDCVIDGGIGGNIPSTIIDFTSNIPLIVRQGKGKI